MKRLFFLFLLLSSIGCSLLFSSLIFSSAHAEEIRKLVINEQTLAKEIETRIKRVPEFQFIRQEAERLGIKVYLFGGTAAAYSHYVRQDLAREAGDNHYSAQFYDYDYTNIFRSTQDLDVVVDGSAEKAAELENSLKKKFPHFIGDKGAKWEVRPLREARGEKEAILGNPDFMNQHTDSHSTGMVEISNTTQGESAIKDVRDWNSKTPQFLKDVSTQNLHYYFSPLHSSTNRASKGLNPPILSVIRYLTKAFQYDLEISPEDKKIISKIIQDFSPSSVRDGAYLEHWIEKNGKKLFEHAVDIEHAWNTLEEFGLRKKLIAVKNDPKIEGSLAWVMSKEPLRSMPVGSGYGRTASQIARLMGEDKLIVAHGTKSYLAYESITRSKAGDLNAYISRQSAVGEAAVHGDGFYTKIGRSGAAGQGITIRMEINPNAREGTDFIHTGDFILIKNKNAVRVIPEQINLSMVEYFRFLSEGNEFSSDDKALIESFKRRISRASLVTEKEMEEIHNIVKNNFLSKEKTSPALLQEWLSLPIEKKHIELMELLTKKGTMNNWLAEYLAGKAEWEKYPEVIEMLIKNNVDSRVIVQTLSNPVWAKHSELVDLLIQKQGNSVSGYIAMNLLSKPEWKYPKLLEEILNNGHNDKSLVEFVLPMPHWDDHPEYLKTILDRNDELDPLIASTTLRRATWSHHPEFIDTLISRGKSDKELATYILGMPYWQKHTNAEKWVEILLQRGNVDNELISGILTTPSWSSHPKINEWIEHILKKGKISKANVLSALIKNNAELNPTFIHYLTESIYSGNLNPEVFPTLIKESTQKHPDFKKWMEQLLSNQNSESLVKPVLRDPSWQKHPEIMLIAIEKNQNNKAFLDELLISVLTDRGWTEHPEILEKIIQLEHTPPFVTVALRMEHWLTHPKSSELIDALLKKNDPEINNMFVKNVLIREDASRHPKGAEWLKAMLLDDRNEDKAMESIINSPQWKKNPYVQSLTGGKNISVHSLRRELKNNSMNKLAESPSNPSKTAASAIESSSSSNASCPNLFQMFFFPGLLK